MPVYSMTGYASGQNGSAGSHSGRSTASAAGRLGSKSARSTAASSTSPFACRKNCASMNRAARAAHGQAQARQGRSARRHREQRRPGRCRRALRKLLQRLNGVQDTVKAWLPERPRPERGRRAAPGRRRQRRPRRLGADLLEVAGKALEGLMSARQREGARLAKMLGHLGQLRSWCSRPARWCRSWSSSSAPASWSAGRRPWA
jgi:hypothetical protein